MYCRVCTMIRCKVNIEREVPSVCECKSSERRKSHTPSLWLKDRGLHKSMVVSGYKAGNSRPCMQETRSLEAWRRIWRNLRRIGRQCETSVDVGLKWITSKLGKMLLPAGWHPTYRRRGEGYYRSAEVFLTECSERKCTIAHSGGIV